MRAGNGTSWDEQDPATRKKNSTEWVLPRKGERPALNGEKEED